MKNTAICPADHVDLLLVKTLTHFFFLDRFWTFSIVDSSSLLKNKYLRVEKKTRDKEANLNKMMKVGMTLD